ncbi:MAG: cation:dicarboxylase symporter family transporter [Acidobacteria bacterium]|nr:cation:dicarboxylase symporter family transporter [Acidobacteriota bacterium]
MNGSAAMLAGLALGLALGLFLPAAAPFVEPAGLLWFNAVRMTVIPIVMAQLILGVNTRVDARDLGSLGWKAFAWFIVLLASTATFAAAVTYPFLRWMPAVPPSAAAAPAPIPGFGEWIANLLPGNVLQAAAEGRLLALIFFALLFGAAVRQCSQDRKQALLLVVAAVSDAMLTIVGWVMRVAPYGVAALAVGVAAKLGSSVAGAFGYYVLLFCGIQVAITLALYLLVFARSRVDIRKWTTAVAPIQTLAFSSRSSLAALPAMVAAAEQRLGLTIAITGFVLPLAAACFRYSTPVAHVAGALFVAHLYSIELSTVQIVLMLVTTVFLSLSSPGIPSGGLLVALPLFHQLGLPPEGLGLLIAVDAIPDMFKTMANVTAHMAVATILALPRYTIGR